MQSKPPLSIRVDCIEVSWSLGAEPILQVQDVLFRGERFCRCGLGPGRVEAAGRDRVVYPRELLHAEAVVLLVVVGRIHGVERGSPGELAVLLADSCCRALGCRAVADLAPREYRIEDQPGLHSYLELAAGRLRCKHGLDRLECFHGAPRRVDRFPVAQPREVVQLAAGESALGLPSVTDSNRAEAETRALALAILLMAEEGTPLELQPALASSATEAAVAESGKHAQQLVLF